MEESDVPRAISELYRVTRPGGYCLLGVPKGWAGFTDPLFRSAGYEIVLQQRPGRVLYQRPTSATERAEPEVDRLNRPASA
jgi:hypothetical protein